MGALSGNDFTCHTLRENSTYLSVALCKAYNLQPNDAVGLSGTGAVCRTSRCSRVRASVPLRKAPNHVAREYCCRDCGHGESGGSKGEDPRFPRRRGLSPGSRMCKRWLRLGEGMVMWRRLRFSRFPMGRLMGRLNLSSGATALPKIILAKGPKCVIGYLNRSGVTAETLDEDGPLHRISDCIREAIKVNGIAVAPRRTRRPPPSGSQGLHHPRGAPRHHGRGA
ncbi:hypothetical protein HOY80DRAFT_1106474 [Tuber brumale]|nr:hypothetical protein HOY80DRAFT_1106474 [Tuber brumale]